jgi:ribonuclease HII|tara:strand:- start:1496 stop:2215 length:720 start_codon:yes stop_codon:yes gene_type:complete
MQIVGVDEAGRGPVLGPLVVGLLSIPVSDEAILIEQDISDSKHHSAKKRFEQYEWIVQQSKERNWYVDTIICPPNKIDNAVYSEGLNLLEVDLFASILNRHNTEITAPCSIMLDACDVNEQRFTNRITERMRDWPREGSTINSEHKADANHRIVGGASIVAKVVRDRIMEQLQEELGFRIGSGYPSDPNTVAALPNLIGPDEIHPDVRWSWATVERFWNQHYTTPLPKRKPTGTTLFSM